MENRKWSFVNAENVEPFVCDETYSSKQLTGDEMAGFGVININEGTLKGGCRTAGGVHEDAEIYYITEGKGQLWLDEDCLEVKPGDIIVIPPGVFHWIDNRMNEEAFKLFTLWPKQEQNGVYFERMKAWGTSVKYLDPEYDKKRIVQPEEAEK